MTLVQAYILFVILIILSIWLLTGQVLWWIDLVCGLFSGEHRKDLQWVASSQNIYNNSGNRIGFVKGDNFYNSSGNRIGFIQGQNLHNSSGNRVGSINGKNMYNSSGNRIGYTNGDHFYDNSGNRKGQIKGKNLYDKSGNRIGYTDSLTKKQMILFLYFYLE